MSNRDMCVSIFDSMEEWQLQKGETIEFERKHGIKRQGIAING